MGDRGPLLEARDVARAYHGSSEVSAVRGVTLAVYPGEVLAVMGPSGSGKTTLLGLLAGLDTPDRGEVRWLGTPFRELTDERRRAVWNEGMGIVFQSYGLLPALSAVENVELPLRIRDDADDRRLRATALLDRLDLGDRLEHRTFELSGGQQQRLAVARALVGQPALVLADEPTSEVDERSAAAILAALGEVAGRGGAVIVATHDPQVAQHATRAVLLRDGQIEQEGPPEEILRAVAIG
jgi:putative ABC transport system ATP-binding protein